MLKGIKNYGKCVLANKATLAGYLSSIVPISVGYLGANNQIDPTIGSYLFTFGSGFTSFFLGITKGGMDTLKSYKRVRNDLIEFKKPDKRLEKIFEDSDYCSKVGFKLALKEAKLEERLND